MAKILVANKFYYQRGGDCIYTIDLVGLLQSHGHDVAVFAMQHPETLQTPWNKYFPEEVKFGMGVSSLKAILRPFERLMSYKNSTLCWMTLNRILSI